MKKAIARFLARPAVADWLIARAMRTPYSHLPGYMGRWWLFNPYETAEGERIERSWIMRLMPSARIHHIQRADAERHMHDHPWNARTFLLRGWYIEEREDGSAFRYEGTTARLRFGEFHRIAQVTRGGVWTLFITWRYRGVWGFKVDGKKVPWREYLGLDEQA